MKVKYAVTVWHPPADRQLHNNNNNNKEPTSMYAMLVEERGLANGIFAFIAAPPLRKEIMPQVFNNNNNNSSRMK